MTLGQQLHSIIGEDNREYFTEDEWSAYQLIAEFQNGNLLMFNNNKILYIEGMRKDAFTVFAACQNKRFNIFDEEMAIVTAEAYERGGNSEKISLRVISMICGKGLLCLKTLKRKRVL